MNPLHLAKRAALATLTGTPLPRLFQGLTRGAVPIFMLHRFADRAAGHGGHDPARLRADLAWLRREGYALLALDALLERLREDPDRVARTVVFTVDDGYDDFRTVGWPVFAEFDCPVTVFVTTDFLDARMWFWWDRLEYALERSPRPALALELAGRPLHLAWSDARTRHACSSDLAERLKQVSEGERLAALEQVARGCEVEWPATAPATHAPLRWDDVRSLARAGVAFGPHSVTHPILSRTDDDQSAREIESSWRRLQAELPGATPVFCYPNGRLEDFGPREIATLERLGLEAAVATSDGYVVADHVRDATARYALPRYAWPEGRPELVQIVSGIERAKSLLRGRR